MTNRGWVILLTASGVVIVAVWTAMNYSSRARLAPAQIAPAPTATDSPLDQAEHASPVRLTPSPTFSMALKFNSSAWHESGLIPAKNTCDGENVSPPLTIEEAPPGAQSLAVIVDDPDAPAGDWVHWTVWNIAPDTAVIAEGSIPAGAVEGMTDFGMPGYGGPCPPSGEHRYQFKLYALDTTLNLPDSTLKKDLEQAMAGHILGQATLVGRYRRS